MSNLNISMKTPSHTLAKSLIDQAITTLAMQLATERRNGSLPQGPALDLTFLLSSSDDRPPFNGMRMGGYSEQNHTLFFEAVVPVTMGHSYHAPHYIAAVLQDMIDNAGDFFDAQRIDFDAAQWQQVLMPVLALLVEKKQVH